MKMMTARDDGELKTLNIEVWAEKRNTTSKVILQRLRNDYTEDEAINLPKYKKPAWTKMKGARPVRRYDTDLRSKADRLWLKFATGRMRRPA